jgi:hypothetical protein
MGSRVIAKIAPVSKSKTNDIMNADSTVVPVAVEVAVAMALLSYLV